MKSKNWYLLLSLLTLGSCAEITDEDLSSDYDLSTIDVTIEDYLWEGTTRTSASISNQGIKFSWSDNDTISIYPDQGSQVEFLAQSSDGATTTATFDGGAWALKKGHSFCAFYPYAFKNRSSDNIKLTYSGQVQTGNNNISDACVCDYIYAPSEGVVDGKATFTFKHLGAFLYLELTMPEANTYTSVSLYTRKQVFPLRQKLDLSSGQAKIVDLEVSNIFTLSLKNVTLAKASEKLVVAMFLPNVSLSGEKVYITATDANGKQYCSSTEVSFSNLEQGKAYKRTATMVKEGTPGFIDVNAPTIKLLAVGNSYSLDALAYAPRLLEEAIPNANIELGIIYYGACSLQQHWDWCYNANSQYYTFYDYNSTRRSWKATAGVSYKYCMDFEDWDYVSFQQASTLSVDYNTYQPYLDNLISRLKLDYPYRQPVWMLTHAYADGYKNAVSDNMFNSIAQAASNVISKTSINLVLPYGTAVQNARHSSVSSYGDFGQLTSEGLHLQEGLPRLIASYSVAQSLLNFYGLPNSIADSKLQVSADFVSGINPPEKHGSVQPVAAGDYATAKQCALNAINNPYQITL